MLTSDMVFHSVTETAVLIFQTFYAMTGGLNLQYWLGCNFSVAVSVGYIALFGNCRRDRGRHGGLSPRVA